ncbi:hypothetical protein ACE6H2_023586 [Prunus campanulata]
MCLLNILSGAGDEEVAQSARACGKMEGNAENPSACGKMEYMPNCQEKPCNNSCWQKYGKTAGAARGYCGGNKHVPFPLY